MEFRIIVVKPAADEAWITLRVGNRLYPLIYVRREVLAHEKAGKLIRPLSSPCLAGSAFLL